MSSRAFELAWAAGFFEGEGTVRINKATTRNKGALMVSVVNTDISTVEWFQKRWPGYMRAATGLDYSRQRRAWVWIVAATVAADFLRAIRPFVVRPIVRARIDHGLQFQDGKTASRANRTDAYAEEQFNAYLWMCELNKRGIEAEIRDGIRNEDGTFKPEHKPRDYDARTRKLANKRRRRK